MTDVPAHTIVVGVDGSDTSDRAVDWAAEQARLEGRDLTLVHATGAVGAASLLWLDQTGLDSDLAMDGVRRSAEELLAAAGDRVAATAPDVTVRGVVAELDARDALLELASEAAMVVVGSRGRGPVKSLLLGSVAHALSRAPACPVVVLRPVDESVVRRGIVVGVDESGTSTAALAFAYRLASLRQRPLRVVHVIWDARKSTGEVGPDEEGYDAERRVLAETLAGMAEQYPDVAAEPVLARGMVDRVLVRLAEEVELVAVGMHQRGPIAGLVRGRTASIVTEQSSGTVAVVPEG
ncbi:MAG TPA: universal stress protein [Nocardioides sp.]|nr:universal stress protein [Nocardioides sp.]